MKKIRNYVKEEYFSLIIKDNYIDILNIDEIDNISENIIIIKSKNKKVIVKGEKLFIKKLLEDEILIFGKYNNILFEDINE